MKKDLKVAAVQYRKPKNSKEGQLKAERFVKEAKENKVNIVVLPEYCLCPPEAVKGGYDSLNFISSLSQKYAIFIAGTNPYKANFGFVNRGFIFDDKGNLIFSYDKILLSPGELEDGLKPGNKISYVETQLGRISLLTCRDAFIKYSQIFFDELRKKEVEIVLVPSASIASSRSSNYDIDLWKDSIKTNSKLFYMSIVASGTVGKIRGKFYSFGHALIVNHKRVIVAEGTNNKEEIIYANIDLDKLNQRRKISEAVWQPAEVPKFKVKKEEKGGDFTEIWSYKKFRKY